MEVGYGRVDAAAAVSLSDSSWTRVRVGSPVGVMVLDEGGARTGIATDGTILHEVPKSYFFGNLSSEIKSVVVLGTPSRFVIQGMADGTGEVHTFEVDWQAAQAEGLSVAVAVDLDGDGTPEHTFQSDQLLTREEFQSAGGPQPFSIIIELLLTYWYAPVGFAGLLILLIAIRRRRKGTGTSPRE